MYKKSIRSAVALLSATFAFAIGLAQWTGLSAIPLLLAFSPGGLVEMSLIAIGADAAFVATHHVVRIFMRNFNSAFKKIISAQ
jgi:uncharacterized membrane protein AbrB (regulator of aidB expression)